MDSRELLFLLGGSNDTQQNQDNQVIFQNLCSLVNFLFGGSDTSADLASANNLRQRLKDFQEYNKIQQLVKDIGAASPLTPVVSQFNDWHGFNNYLVNLTPISITNFFSDFFGIQLVINNSAFTGDEYEIGYQIDPTYHRFTRDIRIKLTPSVSILDSKRAKSYAFQYGTARPPSSSSLVYNMRFAVKRTSTGNGASQYTLTLICQPSTKTTDDGIIFTTKLSVQDDAPCIINLNYASRNKYDPSSISSLPVPKWANASTTMITPSMSIGVMETYCVVTTLSPSSNSTASCNSKLIYYESYQPSSSLSFGMPAILDVTYDMLGLKLFFKQSMLSSSYTSTPINNVAVDLPYVPDTLEEVVYYDYLRKQLFDNLALLLLYRAACLWSDVIPTQAGPNAMSGEGFLVGLFDGVTGNFASITDLMNRAILYQPVVKTIAQSPVVGRSITTPMSNKFNRTLKRDGYSMKDDAEFHFAPVGYTNIAGVKNKAYFVAESTLTDPGGINNYVVQCSTSININDTSEFLVLYEDADVQVLLFLTRQSQGSGGKGTVEWTNNMDAITIDLPDLIDIPISSNATPPPNDSVDVSTHLSPSMPLAFTGIIGSDIPGYAPALLRCVVVCKQAVLTPSIDPTLQNTVQVSCATGGCQQTRFTFSEWSGVEMTMRDGTVYRGILSQQPVPDASVISLTGTKLMHRLPDFPSVKGAIKRQYSQAISPDTHSYYTTATCSGGIRSTIEPSLTLGFSGTIVWGQVDLTYTLGGVILGNSITYAGSNLKTDHKLDADFTAWLSSNVTVPLPTTMLPSLLIGRLDSLDLNLLIPHAETVPLSTIAWITELDDITFQLALLADTAANALALAEANAKRLSALEDAQDSAAKWAMITFAIDLVLAVVPMGPVLAVLGEVIAKTLGGLSRIGSRVLGLTLYLSKIAETFKALLSSKGFYDIARRMSEVSAESSILWKLTRKTKYAKLTEDTTDLYKQSLNFTLVDPTEFIKLNVITNYSAEVTNVAAKDILKLTKDFGHTDDLCAASLSVMHRPLGVLPPGIRDVAFWASTNRISAASERKLAKWLGDTRHPTHSYITLTEDLPSQDKTTLIHRVSMIGVGDANRSNAPTGDKAAGIGSYFVDFEVLGTCASTGKRVMRPRGWKECGYTDDEMRSVFTTMFNPSQKMSSRMSDEDKWGAIIDRTVDRILYDKRISSIPLGAVRGDQLRDLATTFKWDYNLLTNNCQNFAHGLYEYARGGPAPSWLKSTDLSGVYQRQINRLSTELTWDTATVGVSSRLHELANKSTTKPAVLLKSVNLPTSVKTSKITEAG